jgi:hypothetical protein
MNSIDLWYNFYHRLDNGVRKHLRSVGKFVPDYKVQHPRGQIRNRSLPSIRRDWGKQPKTSLTLASLQFEVCTRHLSSTKRENKSSMIALMMEAVRTSWTSVCFNETTRRCMLQGCHLHTRRENLKSHISGIMFVSDKQHVTSHSLCAGDWLRQGHRCVQLMKFKISEVSTVARNASERPLSHRHICTLFPQHPVYCYCVCDFWLCL